MRTKRTVLLLLLVVLLLAFAMMLCSCNLLGGGSDNDGSKTNGKTNDPSDDASWKKIDNPNIYNSLLLGFTNVAYKGSKTAVASNNGILTLDTKFKLTFSDSNLWCAVKAKYKGDNPRNDTIVSVDICAEENASADSRVVSAYVYKDELYIAIGPDIENNENSQNNKMKFSMNSFKWTDYFPYEMEKMTPTKISNLSGGLNSGVVTTKQSVAEKRRSQLGDECRYALYVDLDQSITGLLDVLTTTNALKREDVAKIKNFIAAFYGVEESQITEGTLPRSDVEINFETLDGSISKMTVDFDIDLDTKLFSGGKKGSATIEKVNITNNYYDVQIPFASDEEEQAKYIVFADTVFAVTIPLDEYKDNSSTATKTLLKVTTKIFQGAGRDDFVFAEYSDKTSGQLLKGIYIYENIAYFYSRKDGTYQCVCSMDIKDLGELANKVVRNDLGGTATFDPVTLFAYIMNGVSIDNNTIKFSIKRGFYSDVWYNFSDLCTYVNSLAQEDMMQIEDIQAFLNYVKNNEVIMYLQTHTPFFEIIDASGSEVTDIVLMLSNADSGVRLTPTFGEEE